MLFRSDVSFVTKTNAPLKTNLTQWNLSSSTMNKSYAQDIIKDIPVKLIQQISDKNSVLTKTMDSEVSIQGLDYSTRYLELSNQKDQVLIAVLQRSISESLAPYLTLQLNLLALTILGALVFIAGSIFTAKRITEPLTTLVKTAELLEKGDYSEVIQSNKNDEIGHLGRTFDRMREAIAERERKITKLAYWDELTQLPNRAFFTDQLIKIGRAHV